MLDIKQIESFYPEPLKPFKRNLLREYLQYKILEIIFDSKFASRLAFMGGTALCLLHGNPRFSEDLDFDNIDLTHHDFIEFSDIIEKQLKRQGYLVEVRQVLKKACRLLIRFHHILFENQLSQHKNETLFIQVDTQPQQFEYKCDQTILNKFDVFLRINAVPIDLLLAQKIGCIFKRKRPMGRDFYDTVFLLGKSKPNYDYLRTKLALDPHDLKTTLLARCKELDFKDLARDIEPFLFHSNDHKKVLFFPDYIKSYSF